MFTLLVLVSVFAHSNAVLAENSQGAHLINGSKSYQNVDKRSDDQSSQDRNANAASSTNELNKIEPTAGVESNDQPSSIQEEKPLREQMRLPRKGS